MSTMRWIRLSPTAEWEPGRDLGDGRYEILGHLRGMRPVEVGPPLDAPTDRAAAGPDSWTEIFASPGIAFPDRDQPTPSSKHGSLLDMLAQVEGVNEGPEDPDPFAVRGNDRDALLRELQRLRQDCAEAYQVVGTLGAAVGLLGSVPLAKALDNLSAASQGDARPHEDLLPFILSCSDKE
ncbi:hypothetical protein [Azospirillum argentinense]